MGSDDDLKLNTLHRFSKRSPRLVLEEFGSCEVPAGCGGAVIRWRDPDRGLPVTLRCVVTGSVELWLDGDILETGRCTLAYGEHLVALRVTALKGRRPFLLFLAMPYTGDRRQPPLKSSISSGDGSWLATTSDPGESWSTPGFDDGGWEPLSTMKLPKELSDSIKWTAPDLQRRGAAPLVLPRRVEAVWLRKRFVVER